MVEGDMYYIAQLKLRKAGEKILLMYPPTDFQCQNTPSKDTPWKINGWNLQIYHPFFRKENDHREFQVPKNGGTEPYKAVLGVGFPLHQPLHTAFIGFRRYLKCLVMIFQPNFRGPRWHLTGASFFIAWTSKRGLLESSCRHLSVGTDRGGTGGETSSSSVDADADGLQGFQKMTGMTGNDRFIKHKIKHQEISA